VARVRQGFVTGQFDDMFASLPKPETNVRAEVAYAAEANTRIIAMASDAVRNDVNDFSKLMVNPL